LPRKDELSDAAVGLKNDLNVDWLTFISIVATAIAWPVVAVLLLIITRKRLGMLIDAIAKRVIKAKLPGGIEFEFSEKLDKAREEQQELLVEGKVAYDNTGPTYFRTDDPYFLLAQLSPEAAVVESFKEVEAAIIENRLELASVTGRNLGDFVRELSRAELVDSKVVDLL
jgi:hypothetical protein